jgi:hypothetical protein
MAAITKIPGFIADDRTDFAFANANITGNLTAANANLGNTATANYFAGVLTTAAQPNITSVGTLSSLTVSANISTGGLKTDNLYYANGNPFTFVAQPAGANTEVQFNNNGFTGASGNLTFNTVTNKLSVDNITANGFGLSSLQGSNVTGAVANATYAVSAGTAGVANSVAGANVSGQVSNAGVAGTVYTNAQPNITSVGNLSSLTVDNGSYGNVVITQFASVFATGKGPNPRAIYQATGADGVAGIGIQAASGANGQIYANTGIIFTTGATIRDKDFPTGGTTRATLDSNGLSVTGNITSGNANLGNLAEANYFKGDGSQLTNISVGTLSTLNVTGNLTAGNANLGNLATANYLTINNDANITGNLKTGNANLGNLVTANYFSGDGSLLTNIPVKANITSSITSIVAGSTVSVSTDYTDPLYPAGKFVISQLGPVSLTLTDVWSTTTATSKNAYANYLASSINTSNVRITLSLANANFAITSTDSITIGSSTVTGANLTSLGITGTGGTYTIPNTSFSSTVQTTSTSAVTTSLTTDRGVYAATGTSLTTAQPVAYTVNSITGSFSASIVPYWSLNQTFSWSVSVTGTTSSGNLTYSGGSISTTSLSSVGGSSGTSGSIDSTSSYTITTNDYTGAGSNGYGTRTIPSTVNGTVSAATKYYPLFWKTSSSSSVPSFTTSDSRNSNNYATGQGATTSTTSSDYLWLAIPNYPSNSGTLATHAFKHVFGGFDIVDTPAVTGTQTITASGQSYNYSIYGFTGFTQATSIITTS